MDLCLLIKNIGKNIGKSLCGKHSQKPLDSAKKKTLMHLKLLQKTQLKNRKSNW